MASEMQEDIDEMKQVKAKIGKIEAKIGKIEMDLEQPELTSEEKAQLMIEKTQLRTELHDDKKLLLALLREKELLLMQQQAAAATVAGAGGAVHRGGDILTLAVKRFLAELRTHQVQQQLNELKPNDVIKLKEGVFWNGDSRSFTEAIFVRPCYPELLEASKQYRSRLDGLRTTVYTGTPGVGKSHLGALMVAQHLVQGKRVILELVRPTTSKRYWILQLADNAANDLALYTFDVGEACRQYTEETVYIVDGGSPSLPETLPPTAIFASPNKDSLAGSKKFADAVMLMVPPFQCKEMLRCWRKVPHFKEKLSKQDVKLGFKVAGGIARVVLQQQTTGINIEDWLRTAVDDISQFTAADLQEITSALHFPNASLKRHPDRILHWYPQELTELRQPSKSSPDATFNNLRRYHAKHRRLQFASNRVAVQFSIQRQVTLFIKTATFIMGKGTAAERASHRGYQFEQLAHALMAFSGTFNCRLLAEKAEDSKPFTLKLPAVVDAPSFHSAANAKTLAQDDMLHYLMPVSRNQAGFDAMRSSWCYLQMASSTEHSIKRNPVGRFLKQMAAGDASCDAAKALQAAITWDNPVDQVQLQLPMLIFVTTPSSYDCGFHKLQMYMNSSVSKASQQPLFTQAVLRLPLRELAGQPYACDAVTARHMEELATAMAENPLGDTSDDSMEDPADNREGMDE